MIRIKRFNEEYMYTFNNFVYGIDMSVNPELNNLLCEYDAEFRTNIKGRKWVVDFPYHGGQVRGDVQSIIFGINITDDDGNRNYTKEIRNAKEEDYEEDFKVFLDEYITYLEDIMQSDDEPEVYPGHVEIQKIIDFLKSAPHEFYSVEASS